VPSRYIEFVDRDKSIDYNKVLTETAAAVGDMISLQKQNQDALANAFTALGYSLNK
jgi:type I restriction enzyme M protein